MKTMHFFYSILFLFLCLMFGCQSIEPVQLVDEKLQAEKKSNTSIIGLYQNKPIPLERHQIKQRLFISHGNISTVEGLFYFDQQNVELHFIDSKEHQGHFAYANDAFQLKNNYKQFVNNVEQPLGRRYFPFTVYIIKKNDKSFFSQDVTWVFQVRRYDFKDRNEVFFKQVENLMDILSTTVFDGNPGKLMVYEGEHPYRKPNETHQILINQLDIQSIGQNDMLLLAKAEQVSVINGNQACGYLKHHQANVYPKANLHKQYQTDDIVIFNDVPQDIPPLSGVITLTAQTQLSHLNLLLKNRGTLNISMSNNSHIALFSEHINQTYPVKITVNKDEAVLLSIKKITALELEGCIVQKKPLNLPKIQSNNLNFNELTMQTNIIDLKTVIDSSYLKQKIGSKASNYALLLANDDNENIMTRKALALDFSLYWNIANQESVKNELVALNKMYQSNQVGAKQIINKQLKKIRAEIKLIDLRKVVDANNLEFNYLEVLNEKIKIYFNEASRVRFRSSTNVEDLADFNGAGLYQSKGFNLNDDLKKMQKQLLKVMSSLWSEAAYWEREHYDLNKDLDNLAMGVLINESFSNEKANGVLLISQSSLEEKDEYSYGAVINSQIDDFSVVDAHEVNEVESFGVIQSANKKWLLGDFDLLQKSNLGYVFLENANEINQSRKALLGQLLTQAVKAYEAILTAQGKMAFEYSADLEFKIMEEVLSGKKNERVYIKQIRLIKVK